VRGGRGGGGWGVVGWGLGWGVCCWGWGPGEGARGVGRERGGEVMIFRLFCLSSFIF
jgi:hypothetical protein